MAASMQGAGTPANSVFVGNLAFDLSEQDVIDYFSKVGPVKAVRIVTDRETGKPRGFGFVEFYDIPTAESAIRNLSGSELNGRVLRIVFAEGGPGDFRPRREEESFRGGDERGRGRFISGARNKLIGADLSYHSSQGMSALLGQQPQTGAPADQLTVMLARKTRSELYEYLAQMQSLLHQNPHQARQVLLDNPQLTRALFQMEIILGMVNNPLGDIAPKGVAPPGILPPKHFEGPPPGAVDLPPSHTAMLSTNGSQPSYYPPATATGGATTPHQPEVPLPMTAAPAAAPVDPRMASGIAPGPVDPRLQSSLPVPQPVAPMTAAPRPMVSLSSTAGAPIPMTSAIAAQMQPSQAATAAPASVPGMSAEQQALLQQVMSLTPEQIELLPPQQKAQVLALQQQLRGQGI